MVGGEKPENNLQFPPDGNCYDLAKKQTGKRQGRINQPLSSSSKTTCCDLWQKNPSQPVLSRVPFPALGLLVWQLGQDPGAQVTHRDSPAPPSCCPRDALGVNETQQQQRHCCPNSRMSHLGREE